MNFGNKAPFSNKLKLLEDVQNSSPQLRDYYKMFGKKRDLEQYFISQTYERKPPLQIVDSLEFLEDKECNLTNLTEHRCKTRFENEVRFDMNENEKQSPSGVEIREIHDSSPSPRISLRSSDTPAISPEQDLQDFAVNAVSPGTISSSKKLEWDSLGDVGYDNARRGKEMQLKKGDYDNQKEETNVSPRKLNYKVGEPTAHSTPNTEESSKLFLDPEKSPRKSTSVHKKSGKYQLSYKSNRPSNFNFDVKKYYSLNVPIGERSQYEETEQFHFTAKVPSPDSKEEKSGDKPNVTKEKTTNQTQKTDREIQTISKESVSMSAQTDNTASPYHSLYKEIAEGDIESACNEDLKMELTKGSSNTSRAESFEYIPGSVYQNPTHDDQTNLINIQDNFSAPQNSDRTRHTVSSSDIIEQILEKSSSSQDVGPCIHKISKLLQAHKDNPAIIKKVVRKIGKMLIQINYPSDNEAPSSDMTPSSCASSNYTKSNSKSKNTVATNKPDEQHCDHESTEQSDKIEDSKVEHEFSVGITNDGKVGNVETTELQNKEILQENRSNEQQINDEKVFKNNDIDIKKINTDVQVFSFHNTRRPKSIHKWNSEIKLKAIQNIQKSLNKVVEEKYYGCGFHSAPSTLSYSNYLKNKAKNVQSGISTNDLNVTDTNNLETQQNEANDEVPAIHTEGNSKNCVQNDTNTELLKVNDEICKLTSLKLKLENKHRPDTLKGLITILNDKQDLLGTHPDKGASGDMTFRKSSKEPVLVYYNSVKTSEVDEYSTRIPPLNLQNSSSDSSYCSDKNNMEVNNQDCGHSRRTPCCNCKESTRSRMPSAKSVCICTSDVIIQCDEDLKSNQNDFPPCTTSKTSTSSSSRLCACCRCRDVYSQSSSAESCSAELKKYKKIYEKYQKCLTMKAFVKEYDELIEKYKNLKDKRLAQSSTKRASNKDCCEKLPVQLGTRTLDATTSTMSTYKNACCGSERECINRGTSPFDTNRTVNRADVACQNLTPRSSEVSEQLLNQVRKAFAKEYEDITRRLENIKCSCECMIASVVEKTRDDPSILSSLKTKPIGVVDSMVAVTSECSEGPLPLSSQEYILVSQESSTGKSKKKCTCSKTSNDWESREYSATCEKSQDDCKSNTVLTATVSVSEEFEKESEKCENCLLRKKSRESHCSRVSVSSSKTFGDVSKSDAKSSYEEEMNQQRLRDKQTQKCKVACTCAKHCVFDSTKPCSSSNAQSGFSDSQYTDKFKQNMESKCSGSPKKKSSNSRNGSNRTKSYSRSGECCKDCTCVKSCKKHSSDGPPIASESLLMSGSTFRKYECEVDSNKLPKDQQKCKCAKCSCKIKSQSTLSSKKTIPVCKTKKSNKDMTSDDSVVMCLWCKAVSIESTCKICDHCLAKHRQYVENVIQRKKYVCKSIPKAVAYNLIVESSESILEETYQNKPKSLEKVYVKATKIKNNKSQHQTPRNQLQDDKGSTDEQIRDMSSLNSEHNKGECPCGASKRNNPHCCNKHNKNAHNDKTLREMLEENRPDFVSNTNGRQEILKEYNAVRRRRDAEQRKILLTSVHSLPKINQATLDHLEYEFGLLLPKTSKKNSFQVFNSRQMIKEARHKYQNLPEIEKKKLNKKQQDHRKTNLVMASIFSRKLQRKTLKGIVDISHSRQIIAL